MRIEVIEFPPCNLYLDAGIAQRGIQMRGLTIGLVAIVLLGMGIACAAAPDPTVAPTPLPPLDEEEPESMAMHLFECLQTSESAREDYRRETVLLLVEDGTSPAIASRLADHLLSSREYFLISYELSMEQDPRGTMESLALDLALC